MRFLAIGAAFGEAPRVRVFRPDGTPYAEFLAYEEGFRGGVVVALGDVTGDDVADVVTAAWTGGGTRVRVFDGATLAPLADFFAFETDIRVGVSVAVGNLDADQELEIATAAGVGGAPHVRVWDFDGTAVHRHPGALGNFFAFDPTLRGGASVAVGDIDGDGVAELVVGSGRGGDSHVRAYRPDGTEAMSEYAFDLRTERAGVWVAAGGGRALAGSNGTRGDLSVLRPGASPELLAVSPGGRLRLATSDAEGSWVVRVAAPGGITSLTADALEPFADPTLPDVAGGVFVG